jgi:hypothetical protein
MRHQDRLQDAINGRYNRLTDTDAETIDHQIVLTHDWIAAQPELQAILIEAERAEPDLDFETWHDEVRNSEEFAWPNDTEAGRAWLVWQLMSSIADSARAGAKYQIVDYSLGQSNAPEGAVPAFVKRVFRPFFDYLSDQVSLGSAVVHLIWRYKKRVEWFDRDELHRRYEEAGDRRAGRISTAGPRVGEEVYNLDLQRFLFLDAGYITQAKARSASGEADLVGGLDTDDPLICEGKLYDGKNAGKSHLRDGFHQVIRYAHDYNKAVAHLVVFNLTDRLLQFDSDGPAGAWAPYVQHERVRVHLIVVRAKRPDTTASEAGKATVVRISREDLINVEADTNDAPDQDAPAGSGI